MAKAVVTGASGFVGSHLAERLLARGWEVVAALRPSSSFRWLEGLAVRRLDVEFARPFRLPPCDAVFHAAGRIRGAALEEFREGNRDLAVRTLEASDTGRFVLVSSLAAQGPHPCAEEGLPSAPISRYGTSKREGELAVLERAGTTPVTVIRPPVVYGPRDFGLLDLFKAVSSGVRPVIGGPKRVSLVHARDLAEGIALAAEKPEGAGELFYVSNEDALEMSGILKAAERVLGVRALPLPVPDRVLRGWGALSESASRLLGRTPMLGRDKALEMTQSHWCCSPAKAARVLGWKARIPLEQGLEETIGWYRERGLLSS
jgi:dihydroflavonol-4-reductase